MVANPTRPQRPASLEQLEARDRQRLVVDNMLPALVAFLTVGAFVGVAEWVTRPGHRAAIVLAGSLYSAIGAVCLLAVRLRPQWAVAVAILGVSALCATMLGYSAMVQGGGELIVIAMTVLIGGFAVAFPLGLRNQLLASIVPVVGYPIVLQIGTTPSYPVWYSASGLVCFLAIVALASRASDLNRSRILRDSFRQRALAAENARLRDEARAADRAKTDLLSILSHELRTPLNNVRMLAEVLVDRAYENESERDEFLRMICAQSQRANDMVHTMLEFGSIESGDLRIHSEEIDLGALFEHLRSEIPAGWCAAGVELAWNPPSVPITLRTDAAKLEAIVRNLVHNALKHTTSGTVIVTAVADDEGDRVRLCVDDTGEGIPSDVVPHIFDRFARASGDGRGFGLGLYIVKRFADLLGATVRVETVRGAGSRFEVELPRDHVATASQAA